MTVLVDGEVDTGTSEPVHETDAEDGEGGESMDASVGYAGTSELADGMDDLEEEPEAEDGSGGDDMDIAATFFVSESVNDDEVSAEITDEVKEGSGGDDMDIVAAFFASESVNEGEVGVGIADAVTEGSGGEVFEPTDLWRVSESVTARTTFELEYEASVVIGTGGREITDFLREGYHTSSGMRESASLSLSQYSHSSMAFERSYNEIASTAFEQEVVMTEEGATGNVESTVSMEIDEPSRIAEIDVDVERVQGDCDVDLGIEDILLGQEGEDIEIILGTTYDCPEPEEDEDEDEDDPPETSVDYSITTKGGGGSISSTSVSTIGGGGGVGSSGGGMRRIHNTGSSGIRGRDAVADMNLSVSPSSCVMGDFEVTLDVDVRYGSAHYWSAVLFYDPEYTQLRTPPDGDGLTDHEIEYGACILEGDAAGTVSLPMRTVETDGVEVPFILEDGVVIGYDGDERGEYVIGEGMEDEVTVELSDGVGIEEIQSTRVGKENIIRITSETQDRVDSFSLEVMYPFAYMDFKYAYGLDGNTVTATDVGNGFLEVNGGGAGSEGAALCEIVFQNLFPTPDTRQESKPVDQIYEVVGGKINNGWISCIDWALAEVEPYADIGEYEIEPYELEYPIDFNRTYGINNITAEDLVDLDVVVTSDTNPLTYDVNWWAPYPEYDAAEINVDISIMEPAGGEQFQQLPIEYDADFEYTWSEGSADGLNAMRTTVNLGGAGVNSLSREVEQMGRPDSDDIFDRGGDEDGIGRFF